MNDKNQLIEELKSIGADPKSLIPEVGGGGYGDGQDMEEGLKIIKKKMGGIARKLRLKAKKYYKANKARMKRLSRKWKKSAVGKKFARLRKRFAKVLGKKKAMAPKGARISLATDTGRTNNLLERIRSDAVSGGMGVSEATYQQMDACTRAAFIALELGERYDGMGQEPIADAMCEVAEGLMNLFDQITEGSASESASDVDSRFSALCGALMTCCEDYFANHYQDPDMDLGDDDEDDE